MMDRITPISRRKNFFFLILLLIVTTGCGYSRGSLLPDHFKTIYVDNFKNSISIDNEVTEASRYSVYRPGLENDITNEIVERFVFDGNFATASIGQVGTSLIPHFLESFAMEARMNLHARLLAGRDDHHRAEALFKALARALHQATRIDPTLAGKIPSTKGIIET